MVSEEDCSVVQGKKARKALRKVETNFLNVILVPFIKKRVQTKNINRTKEKVKIRGENENKVPILNQDFQLQKQQVKKDMAIPGNLMSGIQASLIPLVQHFRQREILHGWRQFLEIYALHYGITTQFCPCNKSFVFATSEMETCWESCIIHFPTKPQCSTRVDVLETGNVPILFSLPQMKLLGMTAELDPKGDKITCPAFGLYSSPAEYSTMGHIVLELTSLAYQPKPRERSPHSRRHVTFALTDKKSVYPAHSPELDEDDDDEPLVRPDRASVFEDED